jgi:hypothetical protein
MTSRDFDYLTLRNLQPYNPDGSVVSTGYILATDDKGHGYWTNALSTITVSSFNVSTMIYVSSFFSALNVDYLTVSTASISTLDVSTITGSNITTSSLVTSSVVTSSLVTSSFVAGDGSVSTLFVSTLTGPPATNWSDYLYWDTSVTPNRWSVGTSQVHLGSNAGSTSQGVFSVAVGSQAGQDTQGVSAVALGNQAGQVGQGDYSIAVGYQAGQVGQGANTIVLNASGAPLLTTGPSRFHVDPVRGPSTTNTPLFYDSTTKELVYGPPTFISTFSTLVTNLLGVGTSTPQESIDVLGNVNISSFIFNTTSVFTTPGTANIVSIPPLIRYIQFEMIGGGGAGINTATGGTGGYIKGVINVPYGISAIKVFVGSPGGGPNGGPGFASYITVPGTGPLFAIAGAGGGAIGAGFVGGYGGGGAFAAGYEQGGSGSGVCPGQGGSQSGPINGGSASDFSSGICTGSVGNGQSYAGNYEQSLGGSGFGGALNAIIPGGSGYAGGGARQYSLGSQFGAAGGGSSYIDTTHINRLVNFSSFNGSAVTTELPGYGRSGQGGYVTITLVSNSTSINANGDINCRNLYAQSTITSSLYVSSVLQTSTLVVGAGGSGTYPLEITQTGVSTLFTSGYLFNSTLLNSFSMGPTTYGMISLKSAGGIWAPNFYASSDSRIKTDVQPLQDGSALQLVRRLRPVTYRYIDSMKKHDQREYGFLAQEVKPLLPYAVRTESDFIPNIFGYGDCVAVESGATMITLRDRTVEHIQVGDLVKFLNFNEIPRIRRIIDVNYNYIVVDVDLSFIVIEDELTEAQMANGIQKNTVFVYGTRVDDFHVLDKEAIYNVSVGALQEMDRRVVEQDKKIQELEGMVQRLLAEKKNEAE